MFSSGVSRVKSLWVSANASSLCKCVFELQGFICKVTVGFQKASSLLKYVFEVQ